MAAAARLLALSAEGVLTRAPPGETLGAAATAAATGEGGASTTDGEENRQGGGGSRSDSMT